MLQVSRPLMPLTSYLSPFDKKEHLLTHTRADTGYLVIQRIFTTTLDMCVLGSVVDRLQVAHDPPPWHSDPHALYPILPCPWIWGSCDF